MTARFFVEDGLLFGPDGKVYNKLKSYSGSLKYEDTMYDLDGNKSESYSYDSKGRLISKTKVPEDYSDNINASYSYSHLTVIEKISASYGDIVHTWTNTYTYHSSDQ